MNYQIVTRDTLPQVVNLSDWRAKYGAQREAEGHALPHPASPRTVLQNREAAIEHAIRNRCHVIQCTPCETAAAVACGIRKFRAGHSAATAIEAGKKRAAELAWGAVKTPPPGAA